MIGHTEDMHCIGHCLGRGCIALQGSGSIDRHGMQSGRQQAVEKRRVGAVEEQVEQQQSAVYMSTSWSRC